MVFVHETKLASLSYLEAKRIWGDNEVDFQISLAKGRSDGLLDWGPRPFKLINAWLEKEDCKQVLCDPSNKAQSPSRGIAFKLKKAKLALKKWNQKSCGDFDKRILELERKIETLDSRKEGSILNSSEPEDLRNCAGGWNSDPVRLKRYVYEFFKAHFSCSNRQWNAKLSIRFKRVS
ncbi:hypothetical protein V6N13_100434 [Hibiscus sabdariffa]